MAVLSINPRFCEELCCHRHLGEESCQIDDIRCSVKKCVSQQQTVQTAPPPWTDRTRYSPCFQDQMQITCIKHSYGPQTAVGFLHTQFLRESRQHRLSDVRPCHDNDIRCSVKDNVSKPWRVPLALSLNIQVRVLPVNQPPMRYNPSYGPKTAVVTIHPRESRHHRLHGFDPSQNKE